MKFNTAWLKYGGGALVAISSAAFAYRSLYAAPRNELLAKLTTASADVKSLEEKLSEREAVGRRLKEFAESTLGKKQDQVVDRFRNGLSRIAETVGLGLVQVNSGDAKANTNPASSAAGVQNSLKRALRKTPDFSVISGSVEGVGTWPQIMRTVGLLQNQPWIHKVEGFQIELAGRERDRFKLRAQVSTILTPDLAPAGTDEITLASLSVNSDQTLRLIAARNPFAAPPPPADPTPAPTAVAAAPQPAPDPPVPPPPAPPPYDDWRLTGVVTGRAGIEAWVINTKTNEGQTLRAGSRLLDIEFVEAHGERAVFVIAGQRFELNNGESFASRRPIK